MLISGLISFPFNTGAIRSFEQFRYNHQVKFQWGQRNPIWVNSAGRMVCAGSESLLMGSEDGGGRGTEQVASIMEKGKTFEIKEKLIFAQRFQTMCGYEY